MGTAMKILAVRLRSLFDLLDRHLQAKTFQLANQPLALLVYVAPVEVVPTEFLILRAILQDVIDHHQNTMAYGYERLLLAHPFHQAFILCRQVGPLLVARCPRRLHQRRPQVATAFGGLATLTLARAFV